MKNIFKTDKYFYNFYYKNSDTWSILDWIAFHVRIRNYQNSQNSPKRSLPRCLVLQLELAIIAPEQIILQIGIRDTYWGSLNLMDLIFREIKNPIMPQTRGLQPDCLG